MEIAKFFLTFVLAGALWFVITEYSGLPFATGLGVIAAMSVFAVGFYCKWYDVNKM